VSADTSATPGKVPLTTAWRRGLALIGVAAAILAIWLFLEPPSETTTTTEGSKVTKERAINRPDSIILGAGAIALVFFLTAASAGAIGLSFGGVSVDVNELVKERDQAAKRAELSDQALALVTPTPEPGRVSDAPPSDGRLVEQLSMVASTNQEPRGAGGFGDQVMAALRQLPGVSVEDLRRSADRGADFLVKRGNVAVVIEAKRLNRRSSLELSAAFVELSQARERGGAQFGLLVLPDETMLTGAVGQPNIGVTFLPRLAGDVVALFERAGG
jgi:hypothetical protein